MDGWADLLLSEARDFIAAHEHQDVSALALKRLPLAPALRPLVLDQIKSRQKAREKLPRWHRTAGVVFPRPALIEQASSEATAAYKAGLARGARFVDLTAGAGVDAAAFSAVFASGACVEPDPEAAALLRHNLPLVAARGQGLAVAEARAEDQLAGLGRVDLAFLDPQRRDQHGRRGFRLEDGQPDPVALIARLQGVAERVVLKASPMLDIQAACSALPGVVSVHVVEWRGECREVLYLIAPGARVEEASRRIRCSAIDDLGAECAAFDFTRAQERAAQAPSCGLGAWLVEPGPSVLKAGCFDLVAARFGLGKLHPSTHLYTCGSLEAVPADLPARVYAVLGVLRVDARAVAAALPQRRARLSLRNFPGTTADLRSSLGLGEGGNDALFACTLADGRRMLVHARLAR